jgi:uncharacterized protein
MRYIKSAQLLAVIVLASCVNSNVRSLTFYHKNGMKSRQVHILPDDYGEYRDDVRNRNGSWKEWYDDGQLKTEGDYKNGKKVGPQTRFYRNGGKSSYLYFKNGVEDGIFKEWYLTGEKRSEGVKKGHEMISVTIWNRDGMKGLKQDKDGSYTEWYPNGNKLQEGTVETKQGGADWRGKRTKWHENGNLSEVSIYDANGVLNGLSKIFYEDGSPKGEGSYRKGKFDGEWKFWYKTGGKSWVGVYKKSKVWSATSWTPNRMKCPHTNVINGNGISVWYFENGEEKSRLMYENGSPKENYLEKRPSELD